MPIAIQDFQKFCEGPMPVWTKLNASVSWQGKYTSGSSFRAGTTAFGCVFFDKQEIKSNGLLNFSSCTVTQNDLQQGGHDR